MGISAPEPSHHLTDEQAAELDRLILTNRKLQAFTLLRDASNIGLPEALDVFSDRFEILKATSPEAFEVDLDHYWDGFYS